MGLESKRLASAIASAARQAMATLGAHGTRPDGLLAAPTEPPEASSGQEGESGHDRQQLAPGALSRDVELLSRALRGWGIPDFAWMR
jgi:hypothetical protein